MARFYFSLRSPYSWLAYRDLLDRYPGLAEEIEWRPFWEPDDDNLKALDEAGGAFLYTPMSRAKHLYVLQDVRRLAVDRGLSMRWPVDRDPWWEVPHLAYLVADRQGRGRAFVDAAYRARWEHGRDICDPATVAGLGTEIGVDGAELARAARDPAVRAEGVTALLALHRDGVFGVPFFVRGRDRFWGVDRLPAFAAGAGAVGVPREPAHPAVRERATDEGHAGGCG
ncbi:2-hydroxychromene-2-carboxylate isomerase [Catenuloplanes indicus]|uniref:2-hydroxychromene-2-carboxylate isomerase n=1 Tax=Catenuloplanes indicus TaxID=137267 RepID=A0AAE4AXA7_9ACTN|nr:DsbA family protein [Catenuloplanes indicus]MDQ0363888.1 2-hydroxychromene-2-carboxylate isomerase [Catenuloplanes indicus]